MALPQSTGEEGAQEALDYLAKQQIKDQSELSTVLKKLKLKPDDFNAEGNERLQELIREDMGGALWKGCCCSSQGETILTLRHSSTVLPVPHLSRSPSMSEKLRGNLRAYRGRGSGQPPKLPV